MQAIKQPSIRDLAIISDKRTCAIADKEGTMLWYCPWRFDQPSLFSSLIDENGGFWLIEAERKQFKHREYKGDSAILITDFSVASGSFSVTDFMPMQSGITEICRLFSPAPVPIKSTLLLKPDYGR